MKRQTRANRLSLGFGFTVARFLNEEGNQTARESVLKIFELCRQLDDLRREPSGLNSKRQALHHALDGALRKFQFRATLIDYQVHWTGISSSEDETGTIPTANFIKVLLEMTEDGSIERIRRCLCGQWFFALTNKKTVCSDACRFQKFKQGKAEQFKKERAAYMRSYRKSPILKKRKAPNAKKKHSEELPQHRDNDGLHKRRGVWYYCLTVDGKRRFFSTKTRSYSEARTVRSQAIKAQLEGLLPTEQAKWRFETLLAQVLEDRKPHLAANTIRLERERSGPLLKHFSGRRVSEIDAGAIRRYQNARAKLVGPRTVNLECKLLRQILKAAKTWGMVSDDFKALKENRRGPGRAIEEDHERLLLRIARSKPGWDAAFYAAMIAANTTMRGCEIKGLRVGDVNLIEREVTVGRSKTDAGQRCIPLNDGGMWAFARALERATALGATSREHFLFPGFCFRNTKSTVRGTGYDPLRPQKTWRSAWRSLVKETAHQAGREAANRALEAGKGLRAAIEAWKRAAALLTGLRFHDLRHLAITKFAESEASDGTIMSIAGHLDRSMLEHYSHIRAAAKRKAVDTQSC